MSVLIENGRTEKSGSSSPLSTGTAPRATVSCAMFMYNDERTETWQRHVIPKHSMLLWALEIVSTSKWTYGMIQGARRTDD
jgi:hypothetical protein